MMERKDVMFTSDFNKETIEDRTEFCSMIYGGFGVSFYDTFNK